MGNYTNDLKDTTTSIMTPIFLVGVVTYIAATIFLGLFDEVVLALLTCYAIDTDLNGEPKYGPPAFHESIIGLKWPIDKTIIQEGGYYKLSKAASGSINNG